MEATVEDYSLWYGDNAEGIDSSIKVMSASELAPVKSLHELVESHAKRSNDGSKELGVINTCSEEDENRRLGSYPNEGNIACEPFVGMEFLSEEEAKSFYNEYTRRMGFSMCMGNTKKTQHEGVVRSRKFLCSREGFRSRKIDSGKPTQKVPDTRVGCKEMMKICKKGINKWVVTRFDKDHNHVFVSSSKFDATTTFCYHFCG
ncbi:protein FAR1-RELATED SEQUENCE 5-like [Amborella trichopoda]|uniref:protein FAR1-RELATED SEQUENCE 5-like n=1 Tax=Amborella trichopoda TaxID=13333 RepID=UPI0009C05623|nr:protein FAR1-RELATED SEQUENCE 5-like [Amborella trichopoda]XP_020526739.1 protein FAR1-RELATED SEQUENCE 5-like [Amborella trichopoda]XP_020526740.1 protein FAR1-RELATED SEQUENCE 5-like [Amborella trichopoda]|eukprot:XP_020526738.1 protein FAR1-RELATED SEQUENCE 5-like [Amborella trichopoda]